ncbi:MAG: hypothetical protein KIT31_00575 [Deltaproteobacteria bacterium]|nr:hypothetical protein [Deltaproteobacteria bacterium]
MISASQNFVYTCNGTEGTNFLVTLPRAQPDDGYFVTASLAAVTSIFSVSLPNTVAGDRTTTQFRVKTSSAVANGDKIELHIYDPAGTYIVDLRTYGVIADVDDGGAGGAIASANGDAISQAFADHPSNAVFVLPHGTIYVNRPISGPLTAALRMHGLTDVVLTGWGPGATRLVMTGPQHSGLTQVIEVQNCVRATIRDLTVAHGPNMSNPSGTQQNHHIQLGRSDMANDIVDTVIRHVHCGPCIGDGIRACGGTTHYLRNTRVLDVTMRTGGHPLATNGSRSCISFQLGIIELELGNFFLHGAKNTPIDFEPSGGTLRSFDIHDGIVDNSGGQTVGAVSFVGFPGSPLTDSRIANVNVIEGQVQVLQTDNCTLDNVNIYASGQAGMSGYGGPLLYIYQRNTGLNVRNVDIFRDTGSATGPLVEVNSTAVGGSSSRLTIEGGTWRTTTTVGGSSDGAHVRLVDADRLAMRGTRLRLEDPTPSSHHAVIVRPVQASIDALTFDGITVESPNGKLTTGLLLAAQDVLGTPRSIRDITVTDSRFTSSVTTGIKFDNSTATTAVIDPQPLVQGCDFTGATNPWITDHAAFGKVYPILAGNKGSVCELAGTVTPENNVTAVQGSIYTWMNGNATQRLIKTSGTGTSGWKQIPSATRWQSVQRGTVETNITYDGGEMLHANAAAASIAIPLQGPNVGDRITNLVARLKGTGTAQTVQVSLVRADGDGTTTTVQTLSAVNPANAWATFTVALGTPEVVPADKSYFWSISLPNANTFVGNLGYTFDRL